MSTNKFNVDYIFLALLGLIICYTLYLHTSQNVVLSLNNYLAFAGWAIAVVLMIANMRASKYIISILLIAGLLEIFNFTQFSTRVGSTGSSGIPLNPILFLLCIAYYITKRKTIQHFISRRLTDSDKEQDEKHEKMVEFYFNKFTRCNEEEFADILKSYSEYPLAAKTAINKLREIRNI